jgi:hypothetical protein
MNKTKEHPEIMKFTNIVSGPDKGPAALGALLS